MKNWTRNLPTPLFRFSNSFHIPLKKRPMKYKITISTFDGKRETYTAEDPNLYGLMRALEKCEIKWYKIELA